MRETIITCDRCGTKDTGHASGEVFSVKVSVGVENIAPTLYTKDLCQFCIRIIKECVSERVAESAKLADS